MDNHTKKGNNSFGIVITTYIGDIYLTKALLASIKMYLPELPICLIQDGSFELGDITSIYNIAHVIRKENVKDEFLRENCFGSRCTNMIAFWECPFDKFLYLDSDLVLWGNVLKTLICPRSILYTILHMNVIQIVYIKGNTLIMIGFLIM